MALEQSRDHHRDTAVALQLHLKDIEDQSRRNNFRLRGIPEDTDMENLGEVVKGIFRTVLEDPNANIVLDRAHRALGPRSVDPSRPRDVICTVTPRRRKSCAVSGISVT